MGSQLAVLVAAYLFVLGVLIVLSGEPGPRVSFSILSVLLALAVYSAA